MPASVWSMLKQEGLKTFRAETLILRGAQGRAEAPHPRSWGGDKGPINLIHRGPGGEACDRGLAASLCGPGCVGSDSTGTTQKAPGSLCAITWSPQIPFLPVRKAGVGGEEAGRQGQSPNPRGLKQVRSRPSLL